MKYFEVPIQTYEEMLSQYFQTDIINVYYVENVFNLLYVKQDNLAI